MIVRLLKSSGSHRNLRVLQSLLVVAVALHNAGGLEAQTASTPPSTNLSVEAASTERTSATDSREDSNITSRIPLSAAEIISILQEKPQVVIELKTLLAEAQPGGQLQADSITDEMLYSQIASNKDLRENITIFLRARGYVSDADLRRWADRDDDGIPGSPPLRSQTPGSGFSSMASLAYPQNGAAQKTDSSSLGASATTNDIPLANGGGAASDSRPNRGKEARNITEQPQVMHRPAPYNLMSLRDLYTQIPDSPERLERFGSDVFTHRGRAAGNPFGGVSSTPLDVPIGPDYVVGPGDTLAINIWGGISQSFARIIALDGHITLPESGDIQIAGLTLERAQSAIQSTLKKQYRDVQASVTVSRLRTIRIYVVGDVQRPGSYDISSLSSPLNALYDAGGPTAVGSLRILQHYRGKQLIGTVDLYDFLLHGVRDGDDRLQGGDTLIVPATGRQVAVWGAVKRPAIYELKSETSLAELLEVAGGMTVEASPGHIAIERVDANQHRETISFDLSPSGDPIAESAAISSFQIKDGDSVHVAQIEPYSNRVIYLEGHVVRPGRHPYRDGMRLSDVLRSYQDLLPEPSGHGEIVRLVPPDLHAQTIDFDVPETLIGNTDLSLQPFDTIRILGRYEVDPPKVEVRGEVMRPGSYPLSQGMTAAQLVRMAGGFKRDALLDTADLISYRVMDGTTVQSQRADVRIGDAVQRDDSAADPKLRPGDVLTIHQITGWNDIGSSITIEGEVSHPGSYGFREGERLSDILRRSGGFRETAYPTGAVLVRDQVRELEEKSRVELIRQIETSSAAARLSPNITTTDQSGQMQLIQQQQEQILSRLRSQPATGRLVIHISADIDSWAGTPADIEVRRGDVLRIPKRPGFVLINGQVYNASAISYTPGKTARWYLQRAGGATTIANRKEIFVIRANGSVIGRRSGEWYDRDVLSTRLDPGDVVVVPQKIIGASFFWRNLLSTAQIASSIAITTALAGL